ncbi:FAD-dependent oxidoreductase [Flavobacterium sp. Sd200]|uniref:flavin monoamine oxidase family protein n=1 Tax=Flavobacterium sp. Sd200 TaxID=2692211 RepID=UPI00136FC661|nr:NAD(P)/FAD-dependent oxidoreductase [Flavobacterium sp. Sd200]MXN90903.1 FAD-dependent oxidoreductase [Flavobacterium sp. Sd200]
MKATDVIIIGGGAAGLMAAYTLAKQGKTITILEARNRLGGRVHTITKNFSAPTELGAEFVHGNLPLTLGLLKEAGIATAPVDFEMWQCHNDTFEQSNEFVERWDELLEKLNALQEDMPFYDFLQQNFAGQEYAKMCAQVEGYVSGYDTADVHDASSFSLRNEWNHEDTDAQNRVTGGYGALIDYLEHVCADLGNTILLNTIAREILWNKGSVKVVCTNNVVYEAGKVIIALPLGVLKLPHHAVGALQFLPPIPEQTMAFKNIGFGSVLKILLEFDDVFWESEAVTKLAGGGLSTMGFLFADEDVPTFWTQAPAHSPLLTGWVGGPPAQKLKDISADDILQLTLSSLGHVFKMSIDELKNKLKAWHVANWTTEPFTYGSYAYDKVESAHARKTLLQPVEQTLFFAGEYLYDGAAMGTIEAALTSGKSVAEALLK